MRIRIPPSSLESLVSQERIEEPEDLDYKCKWESKRVSFTDCEPRNFDQWISKVMDNISLQKRVREFKTDLTGFRSRFHKEYHSILYIGFILWKLYEKGESGFHPREYDEYCKWMK